MVGKNLAPAYEVVLRSSKVGIKNAPDRAWRFLKIKTDQVQCTCSKIKESVNLVKLGEFHMGQCNKCEKVYWYANTRD